MLAPHVRPGTCAGCGKPAKRIVPDPTGGTLHLCGRCPDPDEIQRRAAEIRENWDELEYQCRHHRCSRDMAKEIDRVEPADEAKVVVAWGRYEVAE